MPGYNLKTPESGQVTRMTLFCPECDLLLKNAVQTGDGIRLCESCYKEIERSPKYTSKKTGISVLDENGTPCCYPDKAVRREIQRMVQLCDYYETHEKDCCYKHVSCDNERRGCKIKLPLVEMKKHVTQECDYRPVNCEYCSERTMAASLQDHYIVCPRYLVQCSRCSETVLRRSMARHRKKCMNYRPSSIARWLYMYDLDRLGLLAELSEVAEIKNSKEQTCVQVAASYRYGDMLQKLPNHEVCDMDKEACRKLLCVSDVVSKLDDVTDYHSLGLHLKIKPSALKRIELDHPQNKRRLSEVIEHWLSNDPKASWQKLSQALEEIGHKVLADQIRTEAESEKTATQDGSPSENHQHTSFIGNVKKGVRKVWGTIRDCTAETIRGVFSFFGIHLDEDGIRRKGKTSKSTGKFRWWFCVKADESVLKKIDAAGEAIEATFKLRVETPMTS